MSLTLFIEQHDLCVAQVLSVAEYLCVNLKVVNIKNSNKNENKCVLNDKLFERTKPALDTTLGYFVYGSTPIIRFLANKNADKDLYGCSYSEKMKVESLLYMCTTTLESTWIKHISDNKAAKIDTEAIEELKNTYKNLNNYLLTHTYLVGENITVADICICAVIHFIGKNKKVSIDLNIFPNLLRWHNTITQQPGICKVLVNSKGTAEEEKKVVTTPEEPKLDDEGLAAKELENFKVNFDMEHWKRLFFNCKDPRKDTMPWLIENFDRNNMSIHVADYGKTENELKNSLLSCNQLGGFMQRFHTVVRRHCFVGFAVIGEEGNYDITGLLMVKGTEIPRIVSKMHPSFEFYTSKKLNLDDQNDRKILEEYLYAFRCEECSSLVGRPIVDVRMLR